MQRDLPAAHRLFAGTFARAFAVIGLVSGFGAAVSAEDLAIAADAPLPAATSGWIVYGAPEIGIYAHTGKANSTSTNITGPRVNPANSQFGDLGLQISPPERSRELVASFLAGATVGFLTPALDVPGRPRVFVDLNVSAAQTVEVALARRGNPGQVTLPSDNPPPFPVGEGALGGGGTQMSVQHQGPQFHAGLGISMEFPVFGDQLIRLKPAAVYSRTILDLDAQTVRPVRLNNDSGANQGLEDFRIISLSEQRTEVYHAVGPSFELEYVPNIQVGPFTLSVFGRAHASRIFSGLKTQMQQCNVAGGQPGECASWKYTQDEWTYRATLGVHLNWEPRAFW